MQTLFINLTFVISLEISTFKILRLRSLFTVYSNSKHTWDESINRYQNLKENSLSHLELKFFCTSTKIVVCSLYLYQCRTNSPNTPWLQPDFLFVFLACPFCLSLVLCPLSPTSFEKSRCIKSVRTTSLLSVTNCVNRIITGVTTNCFFVAFEHQLQSFQRNRHKLAWVGHVVQIACYISFITHCIIQPYLCQFDPTTRPTRGGRKTQSDQVFFTSLGAWTMNLALKTAAT